MQSLQIRCEPARKQLKLVGSCRHSPVNRRGNYMLLLTSKSIHEVSTVLISRLHLAVKRLNCRLDSSDCALYGIVRSTHASNDRSGGKDVGWPGKSKLRGISVSSLGLRERCRDVTSPEAQLLICASVTLGITEMVRLTVTSVSSPRIWKSFVIAGRRRMSPVSNPIIADLTSSHHMLVNWKLQVLRFL